MEESGAWRIILVEDHSSFRQSMAIMFGLEDDFEVIGEADSLSEARKLLRRLKAGVDLAILDLDLPDGEGTDLIAPFREKNPEFAALVLTASLDPEEHARAIEAGASAVLHKTADLDEIVDSMRRLAAGEALMSPEEIVDMIRLATHSREEERRLQESMERLTKREIQVLRALAVGKSNKEIADDLHMSVDTERTHMVNILSKLGAHSRLQALVFATRHGIVEIQRE